MIFAKEGQVAVRWLYVVAVAGAGFGQTFNSGSNGSDGALNFTTPGTVVFNPAALNLNPAGDNVFNFTTINIGPGVTVQLTDGLLRGKPVVWLASGAVTIAGTLDLSGQAGQAASGLSQTSRLAMPGPGGYPGGMSVNSVSPAQPGFGPGGGHLGNGSYFQCWPGLGAAHGTQGGSDSCGSVVASVYDNNVLVPLRGGSGGAGGLGDSRSGNMSGGGGAGGGAIRIASSVSIAVTGSILANGGAGGASASFSQGANTGGGGSGGSIHLIGPTVSGNGTISANGGAATSGWAGGLGRIRLDAFNQQFTGTLTGVATTGYPYNVPLPTSQPSVRVVSIAGISVPTNTSGSFATPDVVMNQSGPVNVSVAGSNVPPGTTVTLWLISDVGPDQMITGTLSGSLGSTTATISATFQPGYSYGFVRATW